MTEASLQKTTDFIINLNHVIADFYDKTGEDPQAIAMALAGAFSTTFTDMKPEVKKQCGSCFLRPLKLIGGGKWRTRP